MADINTEVSKIRVAIYGEEVRDSIADALVKVNNDVVDTDAGIGTMQNGTYISASNTVGQNLKALDTAAQGLATGPIRPGDDYPATSAKFIDNTNEGNYSFVEGKSNIVDGDILPVANPPLNYAHAEGYSNKIYNQGGHAEGYQNLVWGHWGHVEGYNNRTGGEETYDVPGNPSSEMTPPANTTFYDHAEGQSNIAMGGSSHAEGAGNRAEGGQSHAEGSSTTASGPQSHAEGCRTTASELQSHAEGYGTTASGTYSHSEGYMSSATGSCSHAEGGNTTARGSDSHAEGLSCQANGNESHAEGYSTIAGGASSHAEGDTTVAGAYASHAEGNGTHANGVRSHAEGSGTYAVGVGSHSEGYQTNANADFSHAEGYSTTTAVGAIAGLAGGLGSYVAWGASFAHGYYTKIAPVENSSDPSYSPDTSPTNPKFVVGKFNAWSYEDFQYAAFVVGNGTADITRSNAFVVDYSGNATLAGTLTVATDPTANYQVATKHYVDDICGSINSALAAILGGNA